MIIPIITLYRQNIVKRMIKQKLCMLLITYKQIGVHDSFPTSQIITSF